MKDCQYYKGLLVGLLDGELTPEETHEINAHLTRCAACREQYEKLRESTGNIKAISFVEPEDAVIARVWKSPFSRSVRNTSLAMIIGGWLLIAGFGLFEFLTSGMEGLPAKIGVAAIALGFTFLLVQLIRERIQTYKVDPYKEIKR
jgi:anti-sigma factor RsiW